VYRESFETPTRVQGELPEGLVAFALPLRDRDEAQFWGEMERCGHLRCMSSGALDMTVPSIREHIVVLAQEAVLWDRLPPAIAHVLTAGAAKRGLEVPPAKYGLWARQVDALIDSIGNGRSMPGMVLTEAELEESLLGLLQAIAAEASPGASPLSSAKRRAAVASLLAHARRADARLQFLDALCEDCGVSRRTLEYAVREHLGTSIQTFLSRVRLHRARSDLLRAEARGLRVTDVAIRHGFTELGRFAGEYEREFGELPSTTLRRKPPPVPISLRPR